MTAYERIRLHGRPALVRVIRPGVGMRVDRQGEDMVRETATASTTFMIVYKPSDVICRMQMNLHYGELEPADGPHPRQSARHPPQ